jgi:enoyl-CoA hydratase/carnithine racemase
MSYEAIIYEKRGAVGIITFNRLQKKNAINTQMNQELIQAVDDVEKDNEVKVLVITGGPECFSAGADLSEVSASDTSRPTGPNAMDNIIEMKKPTIAAISGWCVAGGLELALCCDLRVASETARIGDAHIRIGTIGGAGSPTRLARLIGVSKAKELILTGDSVDGNEAYRLGLVNRVYPLDKFIEGALELADKIANHSPLVLELSKKAVDAAGYLDEYQSLHHTKVILDELLASPEFRERVEVFLSKGKGKKKE